MTILLHIYIHTHTYISTQSILQQLVCAELRVCTRLLCTEKLRSPPSRAAPTSEMRHQHKAQSGHGKGGEGTGGMGNSCVGVSTHSLGSSPPYSHGIIRAGRGLTRLSGPSSCLKLNYYLSPVRVLRALGPKNFHIFKTYCGVGGWVRGLVWFGVLSSQGIPILASSNRSSFVFTF